VTFHVKNVETGVGLIREAGVGDFFELILHEFVEDHLHSAIIDFFVTNFVTAAFARFSAKGRGVGMLASTTTAAHTAFAGVDRSNIIESQSHVEHLLFSDK
jgi:hypothetical protein